MGGVVVVAHQTGTPVVSSRDIPVRRALVALTLPVVTTTASRPRAAAEQGGGALGDQGGSEPVRTAARTPP